MFVTCSVPRVGVPPAKKGAIPEAVADAAPSCSSAPSPLSGPILQRVSHGCVPTRAAAGGRPKRLAAGTRQSHTGRRLIIETLNQSESGDIEQEVERARFVDELLASDARSKVIVAGPGTGKTYCFEKMLRLRPGPNLVLTFINNLVVDLEQELGELAEVKTFHRFCRGVLHRHQPTGLTHDADYYPSLGQILAADVSMLLGRSVDLNEIEGALHNLDAENEVLTTAIQSGNFYNAVGHTDSVYRMLRHFEDHPESVPKYSQIVVDKFQDFSHLEVRFIEMLSAASPTLIVGDDDQALYGFKHASATYLRDMARGGEYERFELPYCSRCTEVLVNAVNEVVKAAQGRGLLDGRLTKQFYCYMPSKRADSELYPSIVHARCTVQRKNAPYMARYVEERILAIADEDVEESNRSNYPTVLVTGPVQFAAPIYEHLSSRFTNCRYKRSEQLKMSFVDGYSRLLKDSGSRLGWRIISHLDRPAHLDQAVRSAVGDGQEFVALLPEPYQMKHMGVVDLLRKALSAERLDENEISSLESALQMDLPNLKYRLELGHDEAEEDDQDQVSEESSGPEVDEREPRIIVTSLVGAKGLQAGHVFVVGVNGGHFPRDNANPTDSEVCQLIVALTRATKSCNFVSCRRFGASWVEQSVFVQWLAAYIQPVHVDAAYFSA